MEKIGIVGLGIMGRGITHNFLKHNYPLYVWNRTKKVAEEFKEKGAVICESPKEVAQKADIVFEITSNDKSSKEVWTGANGILAGATSRSILVASATLSIQWISKLTGICKKKNVTFMDIALTGGRVGAETGNLTLLCGGQEKILEEIKPILNAISKKIYHFGNEGSGMKYKLILNFLQALHIIGFGQAMKLAKAQDMDLIKVAEALSDRPGGTLTQIAKRAYFETPPLLTFSVENITKDLTYAHRFAKGLDLRLLNETLKIYKKGIKKNLAKQDWTAVNKII